MKSVVEIMLVFAPLGAKGGNIERLIIWLNELPDNVRATILYDSYDVDYVQAKLKDKVRTGVEYSLRNTKMLGRWGSVMVIPAALRIIKEALETNSVSIISKPLWGMYSVTVAVFVLKNIMRTKVSHIIHVAGDPVRNNRRLIGKVQKILSRISFLSADRVVVLSPTMSKKIKDSLKLGTSFEVDVVPISVPLDVKQKEINLNVSDELIFGMLCRLDATKGIDIAINAFSMAYREYKNIRLKIYGYGEEYRKKLENLVCHNGMGNIIEFCGETKRPIDVLRNMDCLLLPSLSEGTPRSILEAASVGVPTIASDVGGIPDIIINNKTGWIVEAGDVQGLARAIKSVAESPDVLAVVGRSARKRVERCHSSKTEVKMLLEIIGIK